MKKITLIIAALAVIIATALASETTVTTSNDSTATDSTYVQPTDTTTVNDTKNETLTLKVVRDGQLIIIIDGYEYTVSGKKIQPAKQH